MGMMDLYGSERAQDAIKEVEANKIKLTNEYLREMKKLDAMIFLLEHYLATGEALNPAIFGLGEDDDSDD